MPSHSKQSTVVIGLIVIAAFFVELAVLFMRAEHTVYAWDYGDFWRMSAGLVTLRHHSIFRAIAGFGWSMRFDYNDLSLLPSACMMGIFSTSRFCYVISNAVFLNVPSTLLCLWLFARAAHVTWDQVAFSLLAFLALLAVPLPWAVTLSGMTDVAGLIMAAIATGLLCRTDLRSKDVVRWLAIGAALALLALSKRWYLYLVIGLLVVYFLEIAVDLTVTSYRSRSLSLTSIRAAAYGPLFLLCGLIGIYFLSFPLPLTILTTNYSYIYSAYQSGDGWGSALVANLDLIIQRFGVAQVALAFLCFAAALFFRQTRRAALYLYLPAWVAWLDVSRVQTLGDHHTLLLYISTAVTPIFLAQQLLSPAFPQAKPWGWSLLILAVLVSCLSYASVFSTAPPFGSSLVQNVFPALRAQPVQRHDLTEIEALMQFVGDKVVNPPGQPPELNVYLLSSSHLMNSSLLDSAGFQLNTPLPAEDYICRTHDVDHRDGFPESLVTAKLVLVADPLQTHLDQEQKVLSVPVRLFLQGQGFAQAFTRDPRTFQFDDGIRVYVYERARPSTPEEIEQLHEQVGVPTIGDGL